MGEAGADKPSRVFSLSDGPADRAKAKGDATYFRREAVTYLLMDVPFSFVPFSFPQGPYPYNL